MFRQRTIKRAVSCTGLGLHSGKKVNLTLCPADVRRGIVFVRTDIDKRVEIKAEVNNVVDAKLATTIGGMGVKVSTVEHLLAALYGLGIDNIIIEVDGPEIPIMDGSAAPFVYLIQNAGIAVQSGFKKFLVVKKKIQVNDNGKTVTILPSQGFKVSYTIDFDHPMLRSQSLSIKCDAGAFQRDISRARTFGFLKEVELMRSMGLAKGGSLDNAIVVGDFRILNKDGLRYDNEFVRHKILDLFGDLSLLGGFYLIGHINAYKSGHLLNHKVVKKIISSTSRVDAIEPSLPEEVKEHPLQVPSFKLLQGFRA